MSQEFCRDVPDPWGSSKSLGKKSLKRKSQLVQGPWNASKTSFGNLLALGWVTAQDAENQTASSSRCPGGCGQGTRTTPPNKVLIRARLRGQT